MGGGGAVDAEGAAEVPPPPAPASKGGMLSDASSALRSSLVVDPAPRSIAAGARAGKGSSPVRSSISGAGPGGWDDDEADVVVVVVASSSWKGRAESPVAGGEGDSVRSSCIAGAGALAAGVVAAGMAKGRSVSSLAGLGSSAAGRGLGEVGRAGERPAARRASRSRMAMARSCVASYSVSVQGSGSGSHRSRPKGARCGVEGGRRSRQRRRRRAGGRVRGGSESVGHSERRRGGAGVPGRRGCATAGGAWPGWGRPQRQRGRGDKGGGSGRYLEGCFELRLSWRHCGHGALRASARPTGRERRPGAARCSSLPSLHSRVWYSVRASQSTRLWWSCASSGPTAPSRRGSLISPVTSRSSQPSQTRCASPAPPLCFCQVHLAPRDADFL